MSTRVELILPGWELSSNPAPAPQKLSSRKSRPSGRFRALLTLWRRPFASGSIEARAAGKDGSPPVWGRPGRRGCLARGRPGFLVIGFKARPSKIAAARRPPRLSAGAHHPPTSSCPPPPLPRPRRNPSRGVSLDIFPAATLAPNAFPLHCCRRGHRASGAVTEGASGLEVGVGGEFQLARHL